MFSYIYTLLGYDNDKSVENTDNYNVILYQKIKKFKEKRAVKIIERSYIKYLKRKHFKKKRKRRRKLYRRIKRTNPKFLKNISEIKCRK
jgi:hypothetical protein